MCNANGTFSFVCLFVCLNFTFPFFSQTRSPEVQQAVSMTPRPSLSELIKQYRRLEALERELGQSMMGKVKETQSHMKRVEDFVQQPILMQGEDSEAFLYQSDPDPSCQEPVNADLYESASEAPRQEILNSFLSQAAADPPEESSNVDGDQPRVTQEQPRQNTEEKPGVSQTTPAQSMAEATSGTFHRSSEPHSTQPGTDTTRGPSREEEDPPGKAGNKGGHSEIHGNAVQAARVAYSNGVENPKLVHGSDLQTPRDSSSSVPVRGDHSTEAKEGGNSAQTADEDEPKDEALSASQTAGEPHRQEAQCDGKSVSAQNETLNQKLERKTTSNVNVEKGQLCGVETAPTEGTSVDTDNNEVTPDIRAKRTPSSEHVQSTSMPQIPTQSQDSAGTKVTLQTRTSGPISLPSIAPPANPVAPNINSDWSNTPTKDRGEKQSEEENTSGSKCADRSNDTNPVLTQNGPTDSASEPQQREVRAAGMQIAEHVGCSSSSRASREGCRRVHDEATGAKQNETWVCRRNANTNVSITVSEAKDPRDGTSEDESAELPPTSRPETTTEQKVVRGFEHRARRTSEPGQMAASSKQLVSSEDSNDLKDLRNEGEEFKGEAGPDEQRPEQEVRFLGDRRGSTTSSQTSHRSPATGRDERTPSSHSSHRTTPLARNERSPSGQTSHRSTSLARNERSPSGQTSHRSTSLARNERSPSGQTSHRSTSLARNERSPSGQTSHRSTSPCRDGCMPSGQTSHRSTSPDKDRRTPSAQTSPRSTPLRRDERLPSGQTSHRSTSPGRGGRTPSGQTSQRRGLPNQNGNTPSGQTSHRSTSPNKNGRTPSGQTSHRSTSPNKNGRTPSGQTSHRSTSPNKNGGTPSGQTSHRSTSPNKNGRTPYGQTSQRSTSSNKNGHTPSRQTSHRSTSPDRDGRTLSGETSHRGTSPNTNGRSPSGPPSATSRPPAVPIQAVGEETDDDARSTQGDNSHPHLSHRTSTPPSDTTASSLSTPSVTQETIDTRPVKQKTNEDKSRDSIVDRSALSSPGTEGRKHDKHKGAKHFRSAAVTRDSRTAVQARTGTDNGADESRSRSVEPSDSDSAGTSRLGDVCTSEHAEENVIDRSDGAGVSNETRSVVSADSSPPDAWRQRREQFRHRGTHHSACQHKHHHHTHSSEHHREGRKGKARRKSSSMKSETPDFVPSPSASQQDDDDGPESEVSSHSANNFDNLAVRKIGTMSSRSSTGRSELTQNEAVRCHGGSRGQHGSCHATPRHQTTSSEQRRTPPQRNASVPISHKSTSEFSLPVANNTGSKGYCYKDENSDGSNKNSTVDKEDDDDKDDERIYDFIGLSQARSYSLPEFVQYKRLLTGNSIQPRCRLHKDIYDIHHWTDDPKSKLPTLDSLVRRHCFLDKLDPAQPVSRHHSKGRDSHTPSLKFPALNDDRGVTPRSRTSSTGKMQNWRSSGQGCVKLPDISLSNGVAGHRNQDAETVSSAVRCFVITMTAAL